MADDDRGRLYLRDTRWPAGQTLCRERLLDILSTDLLPRTDSYLSEVVCRTFTMLDCRAADRSGFRANCSRSVAGISACRGNPSGVRTAGLIRSNHDDAQIVMLQIGGTTRVQQASVPEPCPRANSTSCRQTGLTCSTFRACSHNT